MKLSMWIIANLLEPFEPAFQIQPESPRVLRSARLAHATDCVYVCQDGEDCLYCWGSDWIRLPELSAREGFELLQSLFDSMYDWYAQVEEAAELRDYQRLIDLCHRVLRSPTTLSDGNHHVLGMSSQYAADQVDDEWYHLKTYGYSSPASSRQLTEARVSYHLSDQLMRYRFDREPGLSSCLCAPVMYDGMPVGYLTVLEKERELNCGHMQLTAMLAQLLSPVMALSHPVSDETTSFLKLLLDGTPIPRKKAQQFYSQKCWSPEHTYRVLLLGLEHGADTAWLRQSYFLVASMSAMFPEDLCGMYDGKFVILANDTLLPQGQRRQRLERQLYGSQARIAISLPFPGFHHLPELFRQTEFAMEYGGKLLPERKYLDFYCFAMDYLIRTPYRPETCLTACHPDVYALYRSDEILYRTLWVYLVMDRSVTRTIGHLYVHKNTLLHRLRKIEEFLIYSLGDPYSREYMRLSFALLERHAGLPTPPETPFPADAPEEESWKF